MKVRIEYCGMWNYLPEATRVAAELKEALSVESELIEGSKGIFDVQVDGRLVYSKHETHKFPEQGEVTRLIQQS